MPFYTYRCKKCEHEFEKLTNIKKSDEPQPCEKCESMETARVIAAPAVHYRGSGFYSTDYNVKRHKDKVNYITGDD